MAKDLTAALQALTDQAQGQATRQDKALPAVKSATAIPARTGSSGLLTSAATGGIASPLTEKDFSAREFHAGGWLSTDGLFKLPAIKKVVMKDAVGSEIVFVYAAPP